MKFLHSQDIKKEIIFKPLSLEIKDNKKILAKDLLYYKNNKENKFYDRLSWLLDSDFKYKINEKTDFLFKINYDSKIKYNNYKLNEDKITIKFIINIELY